LAVLSGAAIALATLTPAEAGAYGSPFCIICGELGAVDVVLNILLFMPYGFGFGLADLRWRRAIGLTIATTAAIEFLQFSVVAGRDASLGDVLMNSIGGSLGYLLAVHIDSIVRPEVAAKRVLIMAWGAVVVGIQLLGAYALVPALPALPYYGQIARDLGADLLPFPGAVVAPVIGRDTIRNSGVAPDRVRDALASGAAASATVVPVGCNIELSDIIHIADGGQREVFILAQDHADLVYGIRTGAERLRLRGMRYALRDVFGTGECSPNNDTIAITAASGPRAIVLRAEHRGGRRQELDVQPHVAASWQLFAPWQPYIDGGSSDKLITALWLAVLFAPLGYWLAFGMSHQRLARAGVSLLAIAGVALWGAPALFGFGRAPLIDWMSVFAGAVLGWLLAQVVTTRSWPASDA